MRGCPARGLVFAWLCTLGGTFLGLARDASAEELHTYGISIAIPRKDGAPIADDAWLDAQIEDANRLFVPLGVRFRWTMEKVLPEAHRALHSRADRDALTLLTEGGVIDVFVVSELEDVDEPGRYRMGVCWTGRGGKRFIVLSRIARPTVLAHELGHFFGNGHSTVTNNLMSYSRDGDAVFFDERQKATVRAFSNRFFTERRLVDVGPPLRFF